MRSKVDIDELFNSMVRGIENRVIIPDSSVIDEDGRGAEFRTDLIGYSIDSITVCNITFDIKRND